MVHLYSAGHNLLKTLEIMVLSLNTTEVPPGSSMASTERIFLPYTGAPLATELGLVLNGTLASTLVPTSIQVIDSIKLLPVGQQNHFKVLDEGPKPETC